LWFHDAIYRSWRRDNEQRSAALASRMLRAASIESVERIRQMVLATTHRDEDFSGDTALVVDIDLSILGQSPEIYAQFERAIRREYWWVSRGKFVAGRSAVLRKFAGRATIYQHDHFHDRYEVQARANIGAALAQLEWK
jgi:predicted metal-dependent HD superfamily phosphohydrolase